MKRGFLHKIKFLFDAKNIKPLPYKKLNRLQKKLLSNTRNIGSI